MIVFEIYDLMFFSYAFVSVSCVLNFQIKLKTFFNISISIVYINFQFLFDSDEDEHIMMDE